MQTPRVGKDGWKLTRDATALIVIDMQRGFLDAGAPIEIKGGLDLIPGINRLAARCRAVGIPVVFVKSNRRADGADAGLASEMYPYDGTNPMVPFQGSRGAEFADGLNVTGDDYIVPKIRYSALIPGSSGLEPLLRGLRRDTLMLCGVAADVCVESTTRDAMMLGFRTFVIGDLTAAKTAERHRVALEVLGAHFSRVTTLDDVLAELAQLA
jgi:ureidoacrylate peracid hydrolase